MVDPVCKRLLVTGTSRSNDKNNSNKDLHVVEQGNLALLVANDGESDVAASDLLDVVDPAIVGVDRVGRQTNQLDAALGELGLQLGKGAQLGGAHGREVLRVGEEDDPAVADKLVEVNGALGGFGLEVGGFGAQTEGSRLRHGDDDGGVLFCFGVKKDGKLGV